MTRGVSILCFILQVLGVGAQSVTTVFYKDQYFRNEVPASKGKFSKTVSNEGDGRVTTEIKELKTNEVIMREIYKGDEPFGVWFYKNGDKDIFLDYEFEMVYSQQKFEENEFSKKLTDFFEDNDSLGYKAPVIATGEKDMGRFVNNNLFFPIRAREEGMQGRVQVGFTINKDGIVEDFVIYNGVNKLLDKEAMRVIRKLRLSSPARVKGEPKMFKLMLPINYKID